MQSDESHLKLKIEYHQSLDRCRGFFCKNSAKVLTNPFFNAIIIISNAMTKTSSLGNRFQRAWDGEIHVSEPMRITLPSSDPKGCGFKFIGDFCSFYGRFLFILWAAYVLFAPFRISVGDAIICTLQQTRVIAFVYARIRAGIASMTESGNFRWHHG